MTTRLKKIAACGLASALLLLPGCQTLAPTGAASALPGLASLTGDRQLAELAEHDPFPTPSDVGIDAQ